MADAFHTPLEHLSSADASLASTPKHAPCMPGDDGDGGATSLDSASGADPQGQQPATAGASDPIEYLQPSSAPHLQTPPATYSPAQPPGSLLPAAAGGQAAAVSEPPEAANGRTQLGAEASTEAPTQAPQPHDMALAEAEALERSLLTGAHQACPEHAFELQPADSRRLCPATESIWFA